MKKHIFLVLFLIIFCFSCHKNPDQKTILSWKKEILETELAFAKMAKEEGVNKAFLEYVADDGVLLRNDSLILGKNAISSYLKNSNSKGLDWKPDFVEVSNSGDLGYTYGKYTYKYPDSTGAIQINKGVFHTVWKKQSNGHWKFVWD